MRRSSLIKPGIVAVDFRWGFRSLDGISTTSRIGDMNEHTDDDWCQPAGENIDHFATERESAWIDFRRERHRNPEPSGEETETSRILAERLTELDYSPTIPNRGVGVVADLVLGETGGESPTIAVRADIDGLRMSDDKSTAYASCQDGLAHACGHDAHTTIALGVAETLAHLKATNASLPVGRIRFLFQAAEETANGAQWMIDDGYLDDVSSVLGLHVEPNFLAGEVGVRYGTLTAAVDEIIIHVRGTSGHTARPHHATDTIHCATMLVSHLYQVLPRSVDVRDSSVFSVAQISGGQASNVIPDEVTIVGTLRTTDTNSHQLLHLKIRDACEHFAAMTGNSVTIELGHTLGSVVNSRTETEAVEVACRDVLEQPAIHLLDRPSMGGEDFAVYMSKCTGSQFRLGCAKSLPWPHLHSPVFDIDERCLAIGVRIMSRAALNLLHSKR